MLPYILKRNPVLRFPELAPLCDGLFRLCREKGATAYSERGGKDCDIFDKGIDFVLRTYAQPKNHIHQLHHV